MWMLIIGIVLIMVILYILIINLEKRVYSKKLQKRKQSGFVSRRQKMREYNKRN
jgi:hypothetical protein